MGASTVRVFGQAPFAEIGDPTAVASSADLIVVGGDLGGAQWNGRSVYDRSDRSTGWFPVGFYSPQLICVRVLTSRWEVNSVAVDPSGHLVAIGTGSYDGGSAFEGELLIHDVVNGTTTSVLDELRCVEYVEWADERTLSMTLAPPTDEDAPDWKGLEFESFTLHRDDWLSLGRREVVVGGYQAVRVPSIARDRDAPRLALRDLAAARGLDRAMRRQAWAITRAGDGGITVGAESRVEHWDPDNTTSPAWTVDVDGTCTQLFPADDGRVAAAVWQSRVGSLLAESTVALSIDVASGHHRELIQPGHPSVLATRRGGDLLVRDTQHGRRARHPAVVVTASGESLGEVELSAYDLFNHYFDIRGAQEFLILAGENPTAHKDKWVAEVCRTSLREWTVRRLFPLAWEPDRHVFGGPGVLVDDTAGRSIIHAGTVHDGRGLLRGNAFVVRRRYPDGRLQWHVPLDNLVTALDALEGRVVAVTNRGELIIVDAATGSILGEAAVTVAGNRVVPLSLVLGPSDRAWIGLLDGRVIEMQIQ
jgi:hypothetical protein